MKPINQLNFYCPDCEMSQTSQTYWKDKSGKNKIWCKYCGRIIYLSIPPKHSVHKKLKQKEPCINCGGEGFCKELCRKCYFKIYYKEGFEQ